MSFIDHLQPLRIEFVNIITGEVHRQTNLYSHMWTCWNGAELITDVYVYTNNGVLLEKYEWSVIQNGDEIEKMLWFYLTSRRGQKVPSNGLVIGTHDGRNGHWIYPIKNNLSKVTLIDGSETQYEKLRENYKLYTNVKFKNKIVTVHGEPVTWYTGGEGYTDTVVKGLIESWLEESDISSSPKDSVSLNSIMEEEDYDWLHLDVEGIDDELIINLQQRPNVIIFESMNIPQERIEKLNQWFAENNYTSLICNGNTIATKKI
jgi:hypothetical protein